MTNGQALRILGAFQLSGAEQVGTNSLAARVVQAAALGGPAGVSLDQLGDAMWGESKPATWKSSLRTHIAGARSMLQLSDVFRLELVQSRYVLVGDSCRSDVGLLRMIPGHGVEIRTSWLDTVSRIEVQPPAPAIKASWEIAAWRALLATHRTCLVEWASKSRMPAPSPEQLDLLERAHQLSSSQQDLSASLIGALLRAQHVGRAEAVAAVTRSEVVDRGLALEPEFQECLRILRTLRGDQPGGDWSTPPFLQVQREHVGRSDLVDVVVSLVGSSRPNKVVIVEGEAGLGKTQFLAKVASSLTEATLLAAQAIPQNGPLRLIEQLVGGQSGMRLEGDEVQATLFDVVGRVHDRQTVVLVDDIHEADLASVKVLRRLFDQPLPESSTVVIAVRPSEGPAYVGRFLDDLKNRRDTTHIELAPFSVEELADLVRNRRTGGVESDGISGAFANQLLRASGGSPLLADLLLERNLDLDAAAADVARTVAVDFEQLGSDAQRIVGAASLVGREFTIALVAEAVGLSIARAADALSEGEKRGVMLPRSGSLGRFRHELIRTVVRSLLPATLRAQLHERLAEVLLMRGDIGGQSVVHQCEALIDAGSADRAIEVLERIVALQRERNWDLSLQALDSFERATKDQPWLLTDRQRATVALLRGTAYQACESWSDGRLSFRCAFELARRIGLHAIVVEVALASGGSNLPLDGDSERRDWLLAALEIARPGTETRTQCLSELVHSLHFGGAEPAFEPYVHELLALDETNDDPFESGLIHHGLLVVNLGYPPRSSGRLNRALRARETAGSSTPEASGTSALILASCLLAEGDIALARQAMVDFTASARRVDRVGDKWVQLVCEAVFAEWQGDVQTADRCSAEALSLSLRYSLPEGQTTYAVFCIGRALKDGDWSLIDELADLTPGGDESPGESALFARIAVRRSDPSAETRFWRAEAMLRRKNRGLDWTFGAAVLADTAVHLGHQERSAATDLLLPYRGHILVPPFVPAAIFGPADLLLTRIAAVSGEWVAADEYRGQAVALCQRAGLIGWM